MSCTDILAHCDCKKCISICICSCRSIVSSVSAPIKIFVCFKKKKKKKKFMPRTVIALKFKMHWFPDETSYWAEKLKTDLNLCPLMPDEDNNFDGSLVLDFRKR